MKVSSVILGIDPGISGALVALRGDEVIEYLNMPSVKFGKSNRVNGAAVADWVRDIVLQAGGAGNVHALLELVGAMPGQGVTSMFNFGHALGTVEGIIQGTGIGYTLVTPQAWKKRAGLPKGSEKDAARSRALQLWPAWRSLDLVGKGQALADAALIARFGGAA